MTEREVQRVRQLLPEAVVRVLDLPSPLKARITAFEALLRNLAIEHDWNPLREFLGEWSVR